MTPPAPGHPEMLTRREIARIALLLRRSLGAAAYDLARAEIHRYGERFLCADGTPRILYDLLASEALVVGFAHQIMANGSIVFSENTTELALRDNGLASWGELFEFYVDEKVDCPAFRAYIDAIELLRLLILEFVREHPGRVLQEEEREPG